MYVYIYIYTYIYTRKYIYKYAYIYIYIYTYVNIYTYINIYIPLTVGARLLLAAGAAGLLTEKVSPVGLLPRSIAPNFSTNGGFKGLGVEM
jgi:hypothetical protein